MGTTTEELALGSDDLSRAFETRDEKTAEIVRRARTGDKEAFEALVYSHEQMVLRTALRLLRHPQMAQDAAQETFLRLFRFLDRFDENRPLGPWLYRVVVNVCRDLTKKAHAQRLVPLDDAPEGATASDGATALEDMLERHEQRRLVEAALMTLPEKERAALVLRDLEGLSTAEVARILGSSPGTVRSQVSTARVKIKRLLLGGSGASR